MRHAFLCLILSVLGGCTPHVAVDLPDKPINININAKIDHEVRIKVERDVEKLVQEQKDLF
jgi:hypothetical protein